MVDGSRGLAYIRKIIADPLKEVSQRGSRGEKGEGMAADEERLY